MLSLHIPPMPSISNSNPDEFFFKATHNLLLGSIMLINLEYRITIISLWWQSSEKFLKTSLSNQLNRNNPRNFSPTLTLHLLPDFLSFS